jgi:hypothetical protein
LIPHALVTLGAFGVVNNYTAIGEYKQHAKEEDEE